MIIVINGSVAVGKTSISLELQKKIKKSIMIDGDYMFAVHPFELYSQDRIDYLYDVISFLIKYHISNGYKNFIINYIFESEHSLNNLLKKLKSTKTNIKCLYLTCSDEEQKVRIKQRNRDRRNWELKRLGELNAILNNAKQTEFIGEIIQIQGKTIKEATEIVWQNIQNGNTGIETQ